MANNQNLRVKMTHSHELWRGQSSPKFKDLERFANANPSQMLLPGTGKGSQSDQTNGQTTQRPRLPIELNFPSSKPISKGAELDPDEKQ